jgi:hypothetical protein
MENAPVVTIIRQRIPISLGKLRHIYDNPH